MAKEHVSLSDKESVWPLDVKEDIILPHSDL